MKNETEKITFMNQEELHKKLWEFTDCELHDQTDLPIILSSSEEMRVAPSFLTGITPETLDYIRQNHPDPSLESFFRQVLYQEGILVSRQDRFFSVPSHNHDWMELAFLYSGSCEFSLQDQTVPLTKGQCLLVNRNTLHSVSACGENDILINFPLRKSYLNANFFNRFSHKNFITNYLLDSLNNKSIQDGFIFFRSESNDRLYQLITDFLCIYYDENNLWQQDILNSYITLIFIELAKVFQKQLPDSVEDSSQQITFELLTYIDEHFMDCTLASMAEHFHMNANYFSRYIKKHTGSSFKELIQTARLRSAVSLLENSSLSTSEVASRAGYENISFFYKKFKDFYGCSPAEYRRRHTNQ